MEAKITTLIENMPDAKAELINEHGLSLFVKFDGKKILFDTGQSVDFLENAKKLGIEVHAADALIVSHGHYDHSGGVMKFAKEQNTPLPMYVGKEFFQKKYKRLEDGTYHYNGNGFTQEEVEAQGLTVHFIEENVTYLTDRIILFKNFTPKNTFEQLPEKFVVETENGYIQDHFDEEIALGLLTKEGLVLIAGCSHIGIANILENVMERVNLPLYALVGGTHLVEADTERMEKTMELLKSYNPKIIALSHCTGDDGMKKMQQAFPNKFVSNCTGNRL